MESALVTADAAPSSSSRRPGGKGRKKIEIAQILDKNQQQVTFSKRRAGLFKKAAELCVQCSVEIAIVTFSPGGKVFSFGHPNIESTMNRFLTGAATSGQNQAVQPWMGGDEARIIHAYNCHYEQVMQEMEKEKRAAAMEKEKRKRKRDDNNGGNSNNNGGKGLGFWWEEDVNLEAMAADELLQYTAAMEELRSMVRRVETVKEEEKAVATAVPCGGAPIPARRRT